MSKLSVRRSSLINYFVFQLLSIATFFAIFTSDNIVGQLFLYSFYCFAVVHLNCSRLSISPVNFFVPFLWVYSVCYPIYLLLTNEVDLYANSLVMVAFISTYAFSAVAFSLSDERVRIKEEFSYYYYNNILYFLIFIFLSFILLYVFSAGLKSKREFLDSMSNNSILSLIVLVYPLTYIFACNYIIDVVKSKSSSFVLSYIFVFTISFMFILMAVVGERDGLFRVLLISFLIYFCFVKEYKKWYLFFFLILGVFILPVTQLMKGFLVGEGLDISLNEFSEVFFSEFAASSRNIHTMYIYGWDYDYGHSVVNDIIKSIPFIGSDMMSTTQWFNEVYRSRHNIDGTAGWGFSLAGQGLLAFGYLGVLVLFSIVGLLVKLLSKSMLSSPLRLAFYLFFISMLIYSIRADVANLLSQGLKNAFIAMIFSYSFYLISRYLLAKK